MRAAASLNVAPHVAQNERRLRPERKSSSDSLNKAWILKKREMTHSPKD
jgi:hypothetical protein